VQISFATRPGSADKASEDFVAAGPAVAIVLDGLTSPPELGTGCVHGTPWYVAQLGGRLLGTASADGAAPLADLVAEAIDHVSDLHAATCDLDHPGTPSSSVALIRVGETAVEHLVLFDSVIVRSGPSGVDIATDHRVDGFAQQEHREVTTLPIGSEGHRDAVRRLVAAQRFHRNVQGGYWVAAAKPEAAHHAVTGSAPRAATDRIALLSDGASCLVDKYGLASWGDLMDLLAREGAEEVIARVRAAEASDPDGSRWPRYKRSDDATAIICTL
jgi:hypothetical protein